MATGVRTGAVDQPLGWNRRSPAVNGSKSLKGGRTVREGVSISGTAAADLERDGGGFLRGLERKDARPKRRRHLARHRLFQKCAVGVLSLVAGVRSRNAPAQ